MPRQPANECSCPQSNAPSERGREGGRERTREPGIEMETERERESKRERVASTHAVSIVN